MSEALVQMPKNIIELNKLDAISSLDEAVFYFEKADIYANFGDAVKGKILSVMRDKELCNGNLEDYARERFDIGKSRLYQLISYSDLLAELSTIVDSKCLAKIRESHVRELSILDSLEEKAEVLRIAIETSPNGKLTATHIRDVIQSYKGVEEEEVCQEKPKPKKPKISRFEKERQELLEQGRKLEEQNKPPMIKYIEKKEEEAIEWEEGLKQEEKEETKEETKEYLLIGYKPDDQQITNIVERSNIHELNDSVIADRIRDFHIVANALIKIKREKLYPKYAPTFEAYCEKWGINLNTV